VVSGTLKPAQAEKCSRGLLDEQKFLYLALLPRDRDVITAAALLLLYGDHKCVFVGTRAKLLGIKGRRTICLGVAVVISSDGGVGDDIPVMEVQGDTSSSGGEGSEYLRVWPWVRRDVYS